MKKNDSNNENKKGKSRKSVRMIKLLMPLLILGAVVLLLSNFAFESDLFGLKDKLSVFGKAGHVVDEAAGMEIENSSGYEVTQLTEEEAEALLKQVSILEEVQEEEEQQTEESEIKEPITIEEIVLSDIYAPSGSEAVFKRYHEDAASYRWEYYDLSNKEWTPAEEEKVSMITDELFRPVSTYKATGNAHGRDMIRCSVELSDGREVVDTASLYTFPEKIIGIQIDDFETDVNKYTNTLSMPVTVTYESGKKETITGLYGLYFLDMKESVEFEQSISGNKIEKQMLTIMECEYLMASAEPREVTIRYLDGSIFEENVKVTGKDKIAPVISELTIGNYTVSNINQVVPVDIRIMAEDNETPYPYLKYAFVHEAEKLDESDFHTDSSFVANIDKNGTWIAYVKDESGNLASNETTIFAVDQKAPELTLSLRNENWCKENVIAAIGKDKTELKYQIKCDAQNIKGDWTSDSSFTVTENGVYVVSAMDAAGNITAEEITVSNIDNKAPVIIGIKEVGGRDEK